MRSVAVACVVLAVLVILFRSTRSNRPSIVAPDATTSSPSALRHDAPVTENEQAPGRSVAGTPETAIADAMPNADASRRLARILGRFVLENGDPVPGVALRLSGRRDPLDLSVVAESAEAWTDLEALSDDDGRFLLGFEPRAAFEFVLDAAAKDACPIRWRWTEFHPGDERDLGDVEVRFGATIVGRILDVNGAPLCGQTWTIRACSPWPNLITGREPIEAVDVSDPETGAFRIEHVPPGRVLLRADRGESYRFEGPTVEVHSQDESTVDVTCPFDVSSWIAVSVSCLPFSRSIHELDGGVVARGSGIVATAIRIPLERSFVFQGLPVGTYSLEIADPNFVPWRADGIELGACLEAKLAGSASVRLAVVDATSGSPIERFTVRTRLHDDAWPAATFAVFDARPDGDPLVTGLLPLPQTLTISAPGFADAEVRGLALAPNETRDVTVQLSRGARIVGSVLAGDGEPPEFPVDVRLARRGTPSSHHVQLLETAAHAEGSRVVRAVRTSGEFVFVGVAPGAYRLQAGVSPALHGVIEDVSVAEGDHERRVQLTLPASGFVHGRVLAPEGASLAGIRLRFVPDSFPGATKGRVFDFDWARKLCADLAADGSYRAGPLPAGGVSAALAVEHVFVPSGFEGSESTTGDEIDLGRFDLTPGADEEHDFDVRDRFPSSLRFTFDLHGRSPSAVVAELSVVHDTYLMTSAAGSLDARGAVTLGPAIPGDYVLSLRAVDASWIWFAPNLVHVSSNESRSTSYDIVLDDGELAVRTTNSSDLPAMLFPRIRADAPLALTPIDAKLDARGRMRVSLQPGRYAFRFRPAGADASVKVVVPFEWPSTSGDAVEVVLPDSRK
ncbi:MAG: carboxypeptidase-like regulatory domain-containing protein [Planctomycetes bacterium]|nr:carboxypeptidase-like regulatory domain-containing protein [Planctomycetota bacterium]